MKPLYTYLHSLFTGAPHNLRRPSVPTRSTSRWYRLRTNSKATNKAEPLATQAPIPASGLKRQYTWRPPLPQLPPKVLGREDTTEQSLGLPMQGITKRMDLGVESEEALGRSKESFNGEIGMDELV